MGYKIVHLWLREIKESPKEEKEEYSTSEVSLDLLLATKLSIYIILKMKQLTRLKNW